MERDYDIALVKRMNDKQYVKDVNGVEVIMKPIPDCEEEGMMDSRLYHDNKKTVTMMRLLPKSMMKMDASEKSIKRLRGMFNEVKSLPIASKDIEVLKKTIDGEDGNKIPIQIYLPLERKEGTPVLYYIHGGGFFGGHMGVVDQLVKLIVEKFQLTAVSIEYRLAPENPYPAGHKDCFTGLNWVYQHISEYGGNPEQIFVAGDSAGGNLAQYCTTRDRECGSKMVKGQLLLYPTVNMGMVDDSYTHWSMDRYSIHPKHKKVIETMLTMMGGGDSGMSSNIGDFLKTTDVLNPYLTPYNLDVKGMCPTFLTVGEHDFLYVECMAYARKLHLAGVDLRTVVYRGMGHAYGDNIGVYPQSEDCAMEMGRFIMEHCQDAS